MMSASANAPAAADRPRRSLFRLVLRLVLVVTLIVALVAWWQRHRVIAHLLDRTAEQILVEAHVPEAERPGALAAMRLLTDRVRAGEISADQAKAIAVDLQKQGQAVFILMEYGCVGRYLEPSGLAAAEKEKGRLAVHRFVRVLMEQKPTDAAAVNRVREIFCDPQAKDSGGFRPAVTDENLREALRCMTKAADAANMSRSRKTWNLGSQLEKDITAALAAARK